MKQVDLKEHDFENRGMSKLTAPSCISGQSEFHCTVENYSILTENSLKIARL